MPTQTFLLATLVALTSAASPPPLSGLRTAIVGGGASGLLLAHRLLDSGATVKLIEARQDPRLGLSLEGRAYALGLGLRGRSAIRQVDEKLWQSVKGAGFGSDRFTLHLPFGPIDLRKPTPGQEPSVLIYQTELCSAMLNELEARHADSGRLSVEFERRCANIDPSSGTVDAENFDLIAGCDGVSSVVRGSIAKECDGFNFEMETLPGFLKVVRLDAMPSSLSADAVHAVPGIGGLSAFLEPTNNGACALISWRSSVDNSEDKVDPASITDPEEARLLLASSLPLIADSLNNTAVGQQFVSQRPSQASTVRCSTYHFGKAVLLGDAAHSTGGASGQGCNSALQDSIALADCLEASGGVGNVAAALQSYSQQRVPEGHALLDLSTGPSRNSGPLRRLVFGLSAARDTLLSKFGLSDPPLQTLLTTSTTPFAEIRRARESAFGPFPTDEEFRRTIGESVRYDSKY